jgi:hypothetical protein
MARMLFIQLHAVDGETVEGAASIYDNGKELPEGILSVRRANSNATEIIKISDMPQHWQDEIKKWGAWGEENL